MMTTQDKPDSSVRLRPLAFEDGPAISALSEQNGMGKLDLPGWRAIWEDYPLASDFQDVAAGWVLSNDAGQVFGYLGNVHQMYESGGVLLKAAIATGWVVEAGQRGKSLQLVMAFYKQKGVDLYINGSANGSATRILTGFKIPRIPIPDYASPCFWAVRPQAFAKAVLRRKAVPGAGLLSWLAGPAIWVRDAARGSGRGRQSVAVERWTSFEAGLDDHWLRLSAAVPRLRAVRTAAVLEWRFGADLRAGRAILLVAGPRLRPLGYAVLMRRDAAEMGLEMMDIADIQAVGDDREVFTSLILASIAMTRKEGADALKFISGTPAKRRPALALKPYSYQLPFWQLYCKTAASVSVDLSSADDWDFSLFDTY